MSDFGKLTIPVFVGTVVNWSLLGALAVQVYIYYLAFPNDRRSSKCVVAFVVVAEILQTLANSRDSIRMFGAGWGNPQVLEDIGWAWFSVPILGSLIASVGQIFFCMANLYHREECIRPHFNHACHCLPIRCGYLDWGGYHPREGVLAVPSHGAPLRFALQRGIWQINPLTQAWLAATAVSDLIIVAGMVFYLLKARQSEFKSKTKATVSRIIRVTVETGVLCALSAVIVLCLFVAFDGNNYHLGVCIWLSKVYSNSMMIILNSRAHIGHDTTLPGGTTKMTNMTDIVFNSSAGPASRTIQSSMHSIDTMDDDDSNVTKPESMGEVVEGQFKLAM
ncbi:hypothetical protein MSAN_01726000 [Mycena sanguinolenta]|uniref:DUF6534 domain-containing protein n=1 Tax=Mycena sanguinolenta TaxID=230812 RepID=A0A8H7CV40_9AGAR|nr:hypothetical protein MSAN_01726000 [Mycena sanguinolenta]